MTSRRISHGCILLASLAFVSYSAASALLATSAADSGGPTVVGDYAQAMVVVLVHVDQEPTFDAKSDDYFTEVIIDQVIKPHDFVKDKKSLKLKRRIGKSKSQFVLFCDVFRDKIDAYRGVEVAPNSELIKYIQGAIACKEKAIGERLRYAFDFLNSSDREVAMDAYREFAIADYKDYMTMAKTLPGDKIAGWLKDPATPPFRYGLYSSLLGHCGTAEHAKLLRSKIEDSIKNKSSDFDGLLAGYVMLQPKEAWDFVRSVLRDGKEDFLVRYACVRTASFLREQRPDLVPTPI